SMLSQPLTLTPYSLTTQTYSAMMFIPVRFAYLGYFSFLETATDPNQERFHFFPSFRIPFNFLLQLTLIDDSKHRIFSGVKRDPAKPTVTISPTKLDPASPNTILLCTARGFYPLEIEIQWLKNGKLEEEGVAFGEELQNGDWTYQLQVMLETKPQWEDIYTCQVGHVSLEAPITVQWEPPCGGSHNGPSWGMEGKKPKDDRK
uniref:Ig-like domain-containing protein n=1 Tax=Pseudonaja textilis TaxID=8673 RepID=A0A670ZJI1_PSETE